MSVCTDSGSPRVQDFAIFFYSAERDARERAEAFPVSQAGAVLQGPTSPVINFKVSLDLGKRHLLRQLIGRTPFVADLACLILLSLGER